MNWMRFTTIEGALLLINPNDISCLIRFEGNEYFTLKTISVAHYKVIISLKQITDLLEKGYIQ